MVQEQAGARPEGATPPGTGAGRTKRNRRPPWPHLVAAVVLAAAITAALLVWHLRDGTQEASVRGTYPGGGLQAVAIPVKSLTPVLAAAFHQNRTTGAATVTGYEFRNAENDGLCLTATDTGPTAGENHDRVEIAACGLTASQIWIPEQWEINGSTFTHLVSDKYQSMCLNADNLGGLGNGQRAQLWNCYYPANNESWDFGDWYRNVQPGVRSYPVCLHTDRLCLDADKYDFGNGDQVNIWTQYPAANQFWSLSLPLAAPRVPRALPAGSHGTGVLAGHSRWKAVGSHKSRTSLRPLCVMAKLLSVHARIPGRGPTEQPEGAPMNTHRNNWPRRAREPHICPRLAVSACATTLAELATPGASLSGAQAQRAQRGEAG